jgi:hypothetical protein
MLVMSRLVSHEECQTDFPDMDLAIGETVRRGGTKLFDCFQNNVEASLMHFCNSLADLIHRCPCICCCFCLINRKTPPEPKSSFLESLGLVDI